MFQGYSNWCQVKQCSGLKQRFIIKPLITEKCKLCEIYRRMCNIYGESCFSIKKKFTNELKIVLPLQAWVEKTAHKVETHWFFIKEEVRVQWSIKNVMSIVFCDLKVLIIIDFLGKGVTVNNALYWLRQNSPYLLNDLGVYVYDIHILQVKSIWLPSKIFISHPESVILNETS